MSGPVGTRPSRTARLQAQWVARQIGPQQVGGIYHCGYWGEDYRVDAIDVHESGTVWFTVTWLKDGRTTHHCTAWETRDSVVTQP